MKARTASTPLKPTRTHRERRAKLLALCGALPGVEVEDLHPHHGRGEVAADAILHAKISVGGKTFAYYQFDHHGDGMVTLCCKAPPGVQQELVAAEPERYIVPAYVGARGWVGARLDLKRVDWKAVETLLHAAHEMTAPKRRAHGCAKGAVGRHYTGGSGINDNRKQARC